MKTVNSIVRFVAGASLLLPLFWSCKAEKPALPDIALEAPVLFGEFNGEQVILKWEPVLNALSFRIEGKETTAAEYHAIGAPAYSPFNVPETEVEFGHSYNFRIKAISGDVESEWSNVVTVDVTRNLPLPVINCSPSFTSIEVEWGVVEGATAYRVEHKLTVGSEWTEDYAGNGEDVSFKVRIQGLETSVSYDVRVAAIANGYTDTYCAPVSVSTTDAPAAIITTADQLVAWLGSISEETTDVAILDADIDMSGKTITSASGFGGIFHGQDHVISNLTSGVPLFATNSGTIRNLVIDASCSFTAGSKEFAPLVNMDHGGTYISVRNRANVTHIAAADETEQIILGGLVAVASGATFTGCSNSGEIKYDASGYNHKQAALGGLVGLIDNSSANTAFSSCVNRGPITLLAVYGDPSAAFTYGGNGIHLGGIAGVSTFNSTYKASFIECQNETAGAIYLKHTDITGLAADTQNLGRVTLAGILGIGQADIKKCKNFALIKVESLITGAPTEAEMKKKNYLLAVGGISGSNLSTGPLQMESCTNSGNIEVEYYGLYDGDDRWRSGVGGICGYPGYGTGSYAYYCKMDGDITVTGKGTMAVGGIFGWNGKQIKNNVTADCTISVNGRKGDVGGLVGYVAGGAENYTIKGCTCAATIFADSDWGASGKDWYYAIGGLMGRWGGANGEGSNASMTNRDGDPCVFSGSISSVYQGPRVGIVVGIIRGSGKKVVFGESNHPIQVSGKFSRKEVEELTINSDNLETYKFGSNEATTTMHVVCN